MFTFADPTPDRVDALLGEQQGRSFSYSGIGRTAADTAPRDYDLDHNRVCIGHGEADFEAAVAAVRAWVMFPSPWTRIVPEHAPIEEGYVVAMIARVYGLWWLNACRIVYVVDARAPVRRFGFAYGTLPAHVESGEERFTVELHESGEVWYDLRAFSRPRYWLVRVFKPLARKLQMRFVRESQQAMARAVEVARIR
jgi:uncharacterized protein (UPF0548 family)